MNILYSHVMRNKLLYLAGGSCLMVGGMFGLFLRINKKLNSTANALQILKATRAKMAQLPSIDFVPKDKIVDFIGRNGHPGNVIYCNETKQVFKSNREAARELGIDSRDLWAYLKGIKPTARGFTFTSIGEAQTRKLS